MIYGTRQDAGQMLARKLSRFIDSNSVVMALTRGGVVLGLEVARLLHAPLGLIVVKKIGHPSSPEYAIGALAEDDEPVYDTNRLEAIDKQWLSEEIASARKIIKQRRETYFDDDIIRPAIKDKTVIVIDDGIATGLTMEAAVKYVLKDAPRRVIVAAPVASAESITALGRLVDKVVILDDPAHFLGSIGRHYHEFNQVSDDEVHATLLESSHGL